MNAAAETTVNSRATSGRVRRSRAFHRPVRMWMVSFLLLVAFFAFCGCLVFAIALPSTDNRMVGISSLACLGGFVVARLTAFVLSSRLHCGLCHGTVMADNKCRKHVDAARIPPLSYRGTAVVSTLFTLSFRCMYCGTPYRLWK